MRLTLWVMRAVLTVWSIFAGLPALAAGPDLANDPKVEFRLLGDQAERMDLFLFEPGSAKGKAYRLECKDPDRLLNMLSSVGFPPALTPMLRRQAKEDAAADAEIVEGFALPCDGSGIKLRWRKAQGTVEYYALFSGLPGRLHRLGCQGLLDALGVHRHDALALTADEIENLKPEEAVELRCRKGEAPAAVELRLEVPMTLPAARRGRRLESGELKVIGNDSVPASLSVVENGCGEWLTLEDNQLSGEVPAEQQGLSCFVQLQAQAGQFLLPTPRVVTFNVRDDEPPAWIEAPAEGTVITLSRGRSLPIQMLTAIDNDDPGSRVDFTIDLKPDAGCAWIERDQNSDGRLKIDGVAPFESEKDTCTITVTAASNSRQAQRSFLVKLAPPDLRWINPKPDDNVIPLAWRYTVFPTTPEAQRRIVPIELTTNVVSAADVRVTFSVKSTTCGDWLAIADEGQVTVDTEPLATTNRFPDKRTVARAWLSGEVPREFNSNRLCAITINAVLASAERQIEVLTRDLSFDPNLLVVAAEHYALENLQDRMNSDRAVYEHRADGTPISGHINELLTAVRLGKSVAIRYRTDANEWIRDCSSVRIPDGFPSDLLECIILIPDTDRAIGASVEFFIARPNGTTLWVKRNLKDGTVVAKADPRALKWLVR